MINPNKTLDKMVEFINARRLNYFDLFMYYDGEWYSRTLKALPSCQNCYSITKGFTAAAIGIAVDMGLLSVDDTVAKFFDIYENVTIHHLLTHTMGLEKGFLFEADRYKIATDDWLDYCLKQPLKHTPGEKTTYSNSNFYLLSRIIHKVSGLKLDDFLRAHLFKPLGINDCAWASCPQGYPQGGTGLYLSTKDMAKLGVLYLNNGVWDGKQVISKEWVKNATKSHTSPDYWAQFGYGLVVKENGYQFAGAYNQFVYINTADKTVTAAHGYTDGKSIGEIYELYAN